MLCAGAFVLCPKDWWNWPLDGETLVVRLVESNSRQIRNVKPLQLEERCTIVKEKNELKIKRKWAL